MDGWVIKFAMSPRESMAGKFVPTVKFSLLVDTWTFVRDANRSLYGIVSGSAVLLQAFHLYIYCFTKAGADSPIIWSRTQDPLSQRRPTDVEHLSQVSCEDLEWLLRTSGQVVHPDIFVLTACRYHVPGETERREGGSIRTYISWIRWLQCRVFFSYLLFWLQSQPNTAAGCLYLCRILPSTVRMTLLLWNGMYMKCTFMSTGLYIKYEDWPESISTTGSNSFRILVAPWYTEYTILTMLEGDRQLYFIIMNIV